MARLTGHARLNFGMVIPRVLVEFVQFATVNICNNDVKELTHLKVLRQVWPVNWSRPFFLPPQRKTKKAVWPRETNSFSLQTDDSFVCICQNQIRTAYTATLDLSRKINAIHKPIQSEQALHEMNRVDLSR